jgi:hypothetical protein
VPSPQDGHAPQSCEQLEHVSLQSHVPSPQTEHAPQSCEQLEHVSPASQSPLPHVTAHCCPHTLATSLTQRKSHITSQQNESTAQI